MNPTTAAAIVAALEATLDADELDPALSAIAEGLTGTALEAAAATFVAAIRDAGYDELADTLADQLDIQPDPEPGSIAAAAAKHGVTVVDWSTHGYHLDDDGWEHQRWTFVLGYTTPDGEARTLTVPYRTGVAIEDTPTVADVLNAITSDALAGDESFEEFCGDYGYDVDSRKAYATWEACRKMRDDLRQFAHSQDMYDDLTTADRL